jgi:hypothetical protein
MEPKYHEYRRRVARLHATHFATAVKGIIAGWLITIVLCPTLASGLDFAAGEKPFSEPSPDGKWLFEASWSGGPTFGSGYLSDIKEIATGRKAFEDGKPDKAEILPVRMSIAWSPDSRYAKVFYYYGRIVSGDVILALDHGKWVEVDLPQPGHPRHMIHPHDRGQWIAGSDIQVECGDWDDHDTITLIDTMKATMIDVNGQKHNITSTRERVVQFSGTIARTISTSDPQYENSGE